MVAETPNANPAITNKTPKGAARNGKQKAKPPEADVSQRIEQVIAAARQDAGSIYEPKTRAFVGGLWISDPANYERLWAGLKSNGVNVARCRMEGLLKQDRAAAAPSHSIGQDRAKARRPAAPSAAAAKEAFKLPEIETYNRPQRHITDDAISALAARNEPARLFQRGGDPVRVVTDEEGYAALDPLNTRSMRAELERAATWLRTNGNGRTTGYFSLDTAEDLFGRRDWSFLPPLNRIVTTPCFAADGSLIIEPGYHAQSRLCYQPDPEFQGFEPPSLEPGPEEIGEAKRLLMEEMLGDFPFVGKSDLAHVLAMVLHPVVRELIQGPTPIHAITATAPGTGKGLLFEAISLPYVAQGVPPMSTPYNEEEWEKKLVSKLSGLPTHVFIDNANYRVASASLASATTALVYEGRILGVSQVRRAPVRCLWSITGNNLQFSDEMARRVVPIRMDALMEQPADRTGFKIADLRAWVLGNRPRIVRAALTLAQAWIAKDRPRGSRVMGSYENWSRVMGGILDTIGVEGFLCDREELFETADTDGQEMRAFVAAWRQKWGTARVGVAEVYQVVQDSDLLAGALGEGGERSQRSRLGKVLQKQKGRIYDGMRISPAGTEHRVAQYRLEELSQLRVAPSGAESSGDERASSGQEQTRGGQPAPELPEMPAIDPQTPWDRLSIDALRSAAEGRGATLSLKAGRLKIEGIDDLPPTLKAEVRRRAGTLELILKEDEKQGARG